MSGTRVHLFVHAFIKTIGERCDFEGELDKLARDTRYAMYLPHLFTPPGGCRHIVVQGKKGEAHHLSWLDVCEGLLLLGPSEHIDETHPYIVRAQELNLPIYRGQEGLKTLLKRGEP